MATAFISTSTELTLLNTTTRAGVIILPTTATIPGRILTFKDTLGRFGVSSITFSTAAAGQTLENNSIRATYNDPFGAYTFISGYDNKWYTIGGSRMFAANISSITSITFTSLNVSTANITTSTLQFRDFATTSTNTLFSLSTNVFMSSPTNFFIVGPTKAPKSLFVPIRRPFLPNQITGLRLWLDATDSNTVSQLGGRVVAWRDKTGINTAFTIVGAPIVFNSSRLNFLPTVRFNGSSDSLFYSAFSISQPITVFGVTVQRAASAGGFSFVLEPSVNTNAVILYTLGPVLTIYAGTANVTTTPTVSYFANITGIYSAIFNSTASYLGFNGTGNSNLNPGTSPWTNLYLGRDWSGAWQDQDVGEVLFYNSALSEANRQQVEGYLAWKWGLAGNLPSNHPFKNSPP